MNGWEFAIGILPTTAAGGLVVPVSFGANVALIAVFAMALRRA